MSIKKSVNSPARNLSLFSCVFPASGSDSVVDYDFSIGMSGSGVVRNTSGSFTVSLDPSENIISGSVYACLQLADDTAEDLDAYRVYLTNVYLKESGSFQVNVMSGSAPVRHDAADAKIHCSVWAYDVQHKKNVK